MSVYIQSSPYKVQFDVSGAMRSAVFLSWAWLFYLSELLIGMLNGKCKLSLVATSQTDTLAHGLSNGVC